MLSLLPLLVLLLPFGGFLSCALLRPTPKQSGVIASSTMGLSFLVALLLFLKLQQLPAGEYIATPSYLWLALGTLNLKISLLFDELSSLLVLIVTGIGGLIHLYSIGYMHDDRTSARYFAHLNLFCFFMLALVMSSSLPLMFFGWEGVGLCSYLLIGHWYEDQEKASAGTKAFIMNRIGDLGFLLGMFFLFRHLGTLEFKALTQLFSQSLALLPEGTLTLTLLLLFAGAIGKSAQIPLATWLPDAMSGPTPVSALIHAATMVTAGVFLLARLSPLYMQSPTAMMTIAIVGGVTALWAASIALAQNDIKKVLAYSTVSQLGLMFVASGVGAFNAAIFHLTTHAFFKALLFLAAGSVIHACLGEQDMRKMGGLKKIIPITFITMLIGALTLAGIPLLSGFFSKDEILLAAYTSPLSSTLLVALIILTSILTALYSGRLIAMAFLGKMRLDDRIVSKLHESPKIMTIPLVTLSILSIFGGALAHHSAPINYTLMIVSAVIALVGFWIGVKVLPNFKLPSTLRKTLENAYYLDRSYYKLIVNPYRRLSEVLANFLDQKLFYDFLILLSRLIYTLPLGSKSKRLFASGNLNSYLLIFALSFLTILLTTFFMNFKI
ncbi:MAG: NADH-quinone oxidoreductase subunit L [Oligoflexia bacterium]|nr:NADH-quinone oxidoreductase subunit L [Oligoflexia bacterium]